MKKSNIVLLNKNGKVKVIKKESEIFENDCKYILIPMLEYDANTFIMIKPKKLLDFTTATVKVSLQLKKVEDDNTLITEFMDIKKTVSTISDLINFIHSIDRIDYVNTVINSNSEYDYMEIIDIYQISITIIKDNYVTYKYEFESPYGTGYSNKSNCEIVILELDEIYQLKNKDMQSYKTNGFINIKNNKWSFDKHPDKDSIIGVNLIMSQSIFFTEYSIYNLFNNCNHFNCEGYVFNRDNIDPTIQESEIIENIEDDSIMVYSGSINSSTFGYIERDHIAILEFILYLRLIYTVIIMKYNLVLSDIDLSSKSKIGFDMYLYLKIISQYNKEVRLNIFKENIPSFDNIIEKIYTAWGD